MKFLIIILLYVSFTSNLVSHGCNRTDIHTNFTTTGVHKSIRLELGIISVCVYDGDSICNVHINNGRGQTSFTTCKKASILDWAFDNFDNIVNETIVAEKNIEDGYNPLPYQLSLLSNNDQLIVLSSKSRIFHNKDINTKLSELKAFIINLWYIELKKGQCDHPVENRIHRSPKTFRKNTL
ncbi:MAG: hypothetical protein ACI30N_04240 [Muribaculaceae bacterium]